MIVNFKIYEINRDKYKLDQTSILIKKNLLRLVSMSLLHLNRSSGS